MTKIVDAVTEYESQSLEYITKAQAQILDAVKTVVGSVNERLPEDRPELPAEVPTAKEIVETQFAFAKKLLANQEKFAKDVLKVIAPLTLGRTTTAKPKVVATTAA